MSPGPRLAGKWGHWLWQLNPIAGLTSLRDSLAGTEVLIDNGAAIGMLPPPRLPLYWRGQTVRASAPGEELHMSSVLTAAVFVYF
jgi:hypothetical protein